MSNDPLRRAFPFHLRIGRDGTIQEVGPMLHQMCPALVLGAALPEVLEGEAPTPRALTFEALAQVAWASLTTRSGQPPVRLRGNVVPLPQADAVLYLGTPVIETPADLASLHQRLPADAPEPTASRPAPTPRAVVPEPASPVVSSAAPLPALAAAHRLRVLVAEDHPVNQLLVRQLLERQGHEVLLATDGRKAVELWEKERVDAILMDLQMPDMSGLDATAAIREREQQRGGRTPIFALTAEPYSIAPDRCLAGGMDGYLPKPLRVGDLARILQPLVQRAGGRGTTVENAGPLPSTPRADLATAAGAHEPPADEAVTESPAPPSNQQGFDRAGALRIARGDLHLLIELVNVFRQQLPRVVTSLEESIRTRNARELSFHAHRLRGSLGLIAARSVEATARALELEAQVGSWTHVPTLWAELQDGLRVLEAELNAFQASPR